MPDDPKPDPEKDPAPDPKPDPAPEPEPKPEPLGDGGKAALAAERKARRDAEKSAKELKERLDAIEAEKLSESEKAIQRAEKAEQALADAQGKIRQAKLLAELAKPDYGIVDARSAAKLLEGVEYDDDGNPTNLGAPDEQDSLLAKFLDSHKFLVGEQRKPAPPSLNGNEGTGGEKPPQLTAEELAAADQYGMKPEEYQAFKNGGSIEELTKAGVLNT